MYAWFGVAWVVVGLSALVGRWDVRRTLVIVAGLIGIPALATVLSVDGTRVFAMVSLPAFLLLVTAHVDELRHAPEAVRTFTRRLLVTVVIASPILPALVSETGGAASFNMPWAS